jgi:hypothetical protein
MTHPHDYYCNGETPELHLRHNSKPYHDPDYRANNCDEQLPVISTLGRGPKGTGVKFEIMTDSDGDFIIKLINEEGEAYISPNIGPATIRVSQVPRDTNPAAGEVGHMEVHVTTARGTESTYDVALPAGTPGSTHYEIPYFVERSVDDMYRFPLADTGWAVNKDYPPKPRVHDFVFFMAREQDPQSGEYYMRLAIGDIVAVEPLVGSPVAVADTMSVHCIYYCGLNFDLVKEVSGDGDYIEVDNTDRTHPVVGVTQEVKDALQAAESAVQSVSEESGTYVQVDNTDPLNPIVGTTGDLQDEIDKIGNLESQVTDLSDAVLPPGGDPNYILGKKSASDFDCEWQLPPGAGQYSNVIVNLTNQVDGVKQVFNIPTGIQGDRPQSVFYAGQYLTPEVHYTIDYTAHTLTTLLDTPPTATNNRTLIILSASGAAVFLDIPVDILQGGTGNSEGRAESARKLVDSRELIVDLAKTIPTAFDGTSAVDIGVKGKLPWSSITPPNASQAEYFRGVLGLGNMATANWPLVPGLNPPNTTTYLYSNASTRAGGALGYPGRETLRILALNGMSGGYYRDVSFADLVANIERTNGVLHITESGNITCRDVYSNTTTSGTNVRVGVNGALYRSTSSKRYKKNIKPYTLPDDFFLKLDPVIWEDKETDEENVGFIAEQVWEAGGQDFVETLNGEIEGIAYNSLFTAAVIHARAQDKRIKELETQVKQLIEKVEAM